MKNYQQIYLPKLAFGEGQAQVINDVQKFTERASFIFPKLKYYNAVGDGVFESKSVGIMINSLTDIPHPSKAICDLKFRHP